MKISPFFIASAVFSPNAFAISRSSATFFVSALSVLLFSAPVLAQDTPDLPVSDDVSLMIEQPSAESTGELVEVYTDTTLSPETQEMTEALAENSTYIEPLTQPQNLTKEQIEACEENFIYPNAIMRRAETAYTKRHYATVIESLRPVYENLHCVDSPDTIIEIYLLLGVSHLELGNPKMADTLFLDVLRTDPDYDPIGAIIILPGSSTERIETLREEHAEELDRLRPDKSHATAVETLFVPGEVEQRPYWINFLPMGAGVFQMHETIWGSVYASTQLAGILMSILGGGMVEHYRGDNYKFTAQNYPHAKNWQKVQIVGISLLAVSYVGSVIHALVIHEPAQINWQSPTKTPPASSHAAAPFILPDGAGLAYETIF